MKNHPPISVTIITLNEEHNLPRALKSVDWADETIVVDSGSSDRTVEIAREFGAKVVSNPWKGYGQQKNVAQSHATHSWILNIDADEEVTAELKSEIFDVLSSKPDRNRFAIPRKTFYMGNWIRHGGWYPNYTVRLYNKGQASWSEPHVHEEVQGEGHSGKLSKPLNHFTFRSIEDQVQTNLRYARFGYLDLVRKGQSKSVLKLIARPIWKFIECYFIKRGVLDGLPGFIIAVNAAHSMFLKYAYFFDSDPPRAEKTD